MKRLCCGGLQRGVAATLSIAMDGQGHSDGVQDRMKDQPGS